jgi:hypothetical protein
MWNCPKEAFFRLFMFYSRSDKTFNLKKETRILKILTKLLEGQNSSYYMSGGGVPFFSPLQNDHNDMCSLCLIITCQLYAIKKVYAMYQTGKKIKLPRKKNTSQEYTRYTKRYTFETDGSDVFAVTLSGFKKLFDEKLKTAPDGQFMESKNDIEKVIENFQSILFFVINPLFQEIKIESKTDSARLDALLDYETLIREQEFVLPISEEEIKLIRKSDRVFSGNHAAFVEQKEEIQKQDNHDSLDEVAEALK